MPLVALIVATVVTDITNDVTVKVVDVSPAGTVTVAGTVAAFDAELLSAIVQPSIGAAPSSVTVPVALALPPSSVDLSKVKLTRFGGVTVSVFDAEETASLALIVASCSVATGVVEMEKVLLVAPASTVVEEGAVAAPLSLPRLTIQPPLGAGLVSDTVPVRVCPPIAVVESSVTDAIDGGLMVNVAVTVPPL